MADKRLSEAMDRLIDEMDTVETQADVIIHKIYDAIPDETHGMVSMIALAKATAIYAVRAKVELPDFMDLVEYLVRAAAHHEHQAAGGCDQCKAHKKPETPKAQA